MALIPMLVGRDAIIAAGCMVEEGEEEECWPEGGVHTARLSRLVVEDWAR